MNRDERYRSRVHRTRTRRGWLRAACTAALATAAWGCAGDGTGLDEFGNPLGPGVPALAPTLTSIQANIFTSLCTRCHTGAAAPLGLRLDPSVSWVNLVGVASTEVPALLRVNPEKPDSSYLVWKLEGWPGIVGGRMPLGLPSLSPEQLAAVRGWIERGAAND